MSARRLSTKKIIKIKRFERLQGINLEPFDEKGEKFIVKDEKMLELRILNSDSNDKALLEKINEEAIPDNERNSLDDLMRTGAEVLGIYSDDEPVGFFVIRKFKKVRYLAYFATRKDLRCKGIGSEALGKLIKEYEEYQVIVEYEAPEDSEDIENIKNRRKKFYLRNGFYETGWYIFYDDIEFEIGCSKEEYDEKGFEEFIEYLGSIISDHIPAPYRK